MGRGALGEVFLARTRWPEAPIGALKVFDRRPTAIPLLRAHHDDDPTVSERLEHPNLVTPLAIGAVDGRSYIAYELVTGKSIAAIRLRMRAERRSVPIAIAVR